MALQTIAQAARELGLTETHVRNMIRKKLWPVYRLGEKTKGLRVDLAEIKVLSKLAGERESNTK